MTIKIGFVSLGCTKNTVDTEIMLGMIEKEGKYEITNNPKEADAIIVNTCGFINDAKEESINAILQMAEYKTTGDLKALIVTGCLAQRYVEMIKEQIPEVDAIIGVYNFKDILVGIEKTLEGKKYYSTDVDNSMDYLNIDRKLIENTGFAYVKISEGCNNRCSYCVIPFIKGKYRSRTLDDIVNECKTLANKGIKEIILIAQDTTRYGIDLYGEKKITELIQKISKIEKIDWIRILYCYPEQIDDKLIDEFVHNPKLIKYIDIPIQHISDYILTRMKRHGNKELIKNVITKLRDCVPNIVIRTTLIVGFPGERKKDFEELHAFIKEYKFDRLGVFTYSKEEGTLAATMKGKVSKKVMEIRKKIIMEDQQNISKNKNELRINKSYDTIVEGVAEDGLFYYGRTYAEAPDIDGKVYFLSKEPLEFGSIVKIKILNSDIYDLTGEVIDEHSK